MATAFLLEWPQVTRSQFRRLVEALPGLGDLHTLAYEEGRGGGRLVVLETWDSPQAFELFARSVLLRAALLAGLPAPAVQAWSVDGGAKGATTFTWSGAPARDIFDWVPATAEVMFGEN